MWLFLFRIYLFVYCYSCNSSSFINVLLFNISVSQKVGEYVDFIPEKKKYCHRIRGLLECFPNFLKFAAVNVAVKFNIAVVILAWRMPSIRLVGFLRKKHLLALLINLSACISRRLTFLGSILFGLFWYLSLILTRNLSDINKYLIWLKNNHLNFTNPILVLTALDFFIVFWMN